MRPSNRDADGNRPLIPFNIKFCTLCTGKEEPRTGRWSLHGKPVRALIKSELEDELGWAGCGFYITHIRDFSAAVLSEFSNFRRALTSCTWLINGHNCSLPPPISFVLFANQSSPVHRLQSDFEQLTGSAPSLTSNESGMRSFFGAVRRGRGLGVARFHDAFVTSRARQ